MAKQKSPGGLRLEDILKSINKNKDLEVPDNIKALMAEHMPQKTAPSQKGKPATTAAAPKQEPVAASIDETFEGKDLNNDKEKPVETKETLPVATEQNSEQSTQRRVQNKPATRKPIPESEMKEKKTAAQKQSRRKGNGFTQSFLKNFLGKNIANLLIKKSPSSSEDAPAVRESKNSDIKQIKADVQEIKSYLISMGKTEPQKPKRPGVAKRFASGFFNGLTRSAVPSGIKDYMFQRNTAKKVSKPEAKNDTKIQRIPTQHVPMAVDAAKEQIHNEGGLSDQKEAEDKKTEVEQEAQHKVTQTKLDKILELLDGIKKKSSGGGGIGGLLAALIAGVAGLINKLRASVLGYIKTIGEWLLKKVIASFSWLRKLGEAAGWVKKLGAAALEGVGAAEVVAGAGAVAITAASAYAINKMAKYETDRAMEPAKGLEKYGLKALGQGKFVLNGKPTTFDELPDDYKHLVGAMTGDTRGGFSRKEQEYVKQHADDFKKLEIKQPNVPDVPEAQRGVISRPPEKPQVQRPVAAPVPKQLPDKLASASADNNDMKGQATTEPVVVVVKGGNKTTVIPAPQKSGTVAFVQTRNPESTISRLNSSMFDDPAGYSNISRL
jgi:hypothetical protein